jgi:hypothetical protein
MSKTSKKVEEIFSREMIQLDSIGYRNNADSESNSVQEQG